MVVARPRWFVFNLLCLALLGRHWLVRLMIMLLCLIGFGFELEIGGSAVSLVFYFLFKPQISQVVGVLVGSVDWVAQGKDADPEARQES